MNIVPLPHKRMREAVELLWDGRKISNEHIYRIDNLKERILRCGTSDAYYNHGTWTVLEHTNQNRTYEDITHRIKGIRARPIRGSHRYYELGIVGDTRARQ